MYAIRACYAIRSVPEDTCDRLQSAAQCRWASASSSRGEMELVWYRDTFDAADDLRRVLDGVTGVKARITQVP